ncbi:MAG: hypothetical protein ABI700_21310 [Chloroflexota bacterium]
MSAATDQTSIHFRSRLILMVGFAVVLLTANIWALFNAQLSLINTLGIVSFGLLLLCPVLMAYQSVRLTLLMQTSDPARSIRDCVQASLRRAASLLLLDALIAVPLFVFFGLYLQIAIANITMTVIDCFSTTCPPESIVHPENFIPQAIWVLPVVIGLWGLNLLASVLGASLAQRWRKAMPATSGTILALVVTVAIIYTLLNLTSLPPIPLDLAVAVLPYLLTWGAWRYLALPAPLATPTAKL